MSDFDKLRSSESVLSLIDLCRDLHTVNAELIKRTDHFDKMFAAVIKFAQSTMDCLDNLESRIKILENTSKTNNQDMETFPELKT